jgi:putative ATP-binding cassette transporter
MDWRIARRLHAILRGFWRGASARLAWSFTLGLTGFLILRLFVDVGFNHWNRWFFDAVGNRDGMEAGRAVCVFLALVASAAAVGVGIVWTRETLQVRWREWCTGQLLDRWIGDQRFLRMTRVENGLANPEYRISDDVRLAIEPLTDFAIGIFTALLGGSAQANTVNGCEIKHHTTCPKHDLRGADLRGAVLQASEQSRDQEEYSHGDSCSRPFGR